MNANVASMVTDIDIEMLDISLDDGRARRLGKP